MKTLNLPTTRRTPLATACLVVLIVLAVPGEAAASRPVYRTLTLAEVVGMSDAIVIARRADPFVTQTHWPITSAPIAREDRSFRATVYRLETVEVLYERAARRLVAGQLLEVAPAGQEMLFEVHRRLVLESKTTSYEAFRYVSSAPEAFAKDEQVILFLRKTARGFELTALGAHEPVGMKRTICVLLPPPTRC